MRNGSEAPQRTEFFWGLNDHYGFEQLVPEYKTTFIHSIQYQEITHTEHFKLYVHI